MLTKHTFSAIERATDSNLRVIGRSARGESKSTFDVLVGAEEAILKILADGPGVLENQQRLLRIVGSLRNRGYPAPEYLALGIAEGCVFTLQRRISGRHLEPGPGLPVEPEVLRSTLPSILDAVELQTDAGDLPASPWPMWLLDSLEHGGDGYCLHTTMRERTDTASILERVIHVGRELDAGTARNHDIVHFDLNPANVLQIDGHLTGVVDWNVPFDGGAQGDRGFDVATLLFYTYDNVAARELLWERLIAISGARWSSVYLAHLVLRQVEWTVRHRPGTAEEQRFLGIARQVLDDCGL